MASTFVSILPFLQNVYSYINISRMNAVTMLKTFDSIDRVFEPVHEISNNVAF